jgi:hypothetical protein
MVAARSIDRGPFAMRYRGATGRLDGISGLELVVRNRAPRMLPTTIVEIELPTGAELTESDRERIRRRVRSVERSEGVLVMTLAPLGPGNEVRIPLPLRWSVAGRLVGLGTVAYAADRPESVSVLAPRALEIREEGR